MEESQSEREIRSPSVLSNVKYQVISNQDMIGCRKNIPSLGALAFAATTALRHDM